MANPWDETGIQILPRYGRNAISGKYEICGDVDIPMDKNAWKNVVLIPAFEPTYVSIEILFAWKRDIAHNARTIFYKEVSHDNYLFEIQEAVVWMKTHGFFPKEKQDVQEVT